MTKASMKRVGKIRYLEQQIGKLEVRNNMLLQNILANPALEALRDLSKEACDVLPPAVPNELPGYRDGYDDHAQATFTVLEGLLKELEAP